MPREAVAGAYDPAKKIIGSGPFLFDSYTPDVAIVFKKNPDYFEKGQPYVDAVKATIVPDAAQRMAQFTGGHLDWLNVASTNDVPTMTQSNPKAETTTWALVAIRPVPTTKPVPRESPARMTTTRAIFVFL